MKIEKYLITKVRNFINNEERTYNYLTSMFLRWQH